MTTEALDAQGHISMMKNIFKEATVKAAIKNANQQGTAGSSGLRYCYRQAKLCDELEDDPAAVVTFVFSSRSFPKIFRTLLTSAKHSSLGQKTRLVASGDLLWSVIGDVFCLQYGRKLAVYFHTAEQFQVEQRSWR